MEPLYDFLESVDRMPVGLLASFLTGCACFGLAVLGYYGCRRMRNSRWLLHAWVIARILIREIAYLFMCGLLPLMLMAWCIYHVERPILWIGGIAFAWFFLVILVVSYDDYKTHRSKQE